MELPAARDHGVPALGAAGCGRVHAAAVLVARGAHPGGNLDPGRRAPGARPRAELDSCAAAEPDCIWDICCSSEGELWTSEGREPEPGPESA